jgi:two-component system LytT family response regulator
MSTARVRAVVVDDEPGGRDAVRTLLADVPEVEVVGEAGDGAEAVEVVARERPDLLFLDIQMPDRDGFAVLEALGDDLPRGLIFVTAHSEHAHRAFEVHAIDYVMKPFGRPRFLAAVRRAVRRLEADEALGMRETLRSLARGLEVDRGPQPPADVSVGPASGGAGGAPARIGVRIGNRTTLVDVPEIDWVEADGELARLHVGERIHLLASRMHELESLLAPSGFLRIHRSIIVNLARVKVLHRDRDGSGTVGLESGVQLGVARGRWEALQTALGLAD